MYSRDHACALMLLLFALLLGPDSASGQSLLGIPRPRQIEIARIDSIGAARKTDVNTLLSTDRDITKPKGWFQWEPIRNEPEGATFWGSDRIAWLPGSNLSLASDKAALFTEMAAVHSGAWRFAVGTTLAVSTGDKSATDSTASAAQAGDDTSRSGFQKFSAGGGNLSLSATRPLGYRNGRYNSQVLFATPRAWANIPALKDAENINDYGGEIAAEYQYQRYRRSLRESVLDRDSAEAPFLTFQLRGGIVYGSNTFFRTIGRSEEKVFAYVAPTLQFIIQNQIKLGVTTFFGPNDFREHQRLRVNFAIVPPKRQQDKPAETNGNAAGPAVPQRPGA